ncbi:MAG: PIN domain-containing protein [Planctomycetota bacterium]|nr:PIN domain-containing protein [Planctomycetota bacterium]
MVCLDTSFLVDFLRGRKDAVEFLTDLQESSEAITVAAPSVFELVEAAEIARSEKEKAVIHELVSSLAVLPLDSETAWAAGRLSAELIFAGEPIGQMDTLIGAIAHHHGEPIVSKNIKHFERIPELRVQEY